MVNQNQNNELKDAKEKQTAEFSYNYLHIPDFN